MNKLLFIINLLLISIIIYYSISQNLNENDTKQFSPFDFLKPKNLQNTTNSNNNKNIIMIKL